VGDGERTPWYPTARIFRRGYFGDWTGIVTRMVDELAVLVAARRAAEEGERPPRRG
jgi:hypothetical protein